MSCLLIFQLILCSIFGDKSFSQMSWESEICNATAILEVSGKVNLLMNLNRVPLIVLSFLNFHYPIDFIGGQEGGQLTGGQCFVETHLNRVPLIVLGFLIFIFPLIL